VSPGAAVRTGSIAALAAAAVLVPASAASACSCAQTSENVRYRQSTAAFIGRLVEVREVEGEYGAAIFRYRVGVSYKRRLREFVKVRGNTMSPTCGLPTEEGQRYALYLYREDGRWRSNLCLVTTPRKLRRAAATAGDATGSGAGCTT
jgi:hypothetical protein